MPKSKMNHGKVDQIRGRLGLNEKMVMISVKMEGDLLDALKARALEEKLPYQTMMKKMLREKLGIQGSSFIDHEELRRIVGEIVEEKLKSKRKKAG
ncbi:MAG: hypothetical protein ACXWQO_10890 [Bdellovibrionota bacterium]